MAVAPRLSLVTLGVVDLERAKAFYQALGWSPVSEADDVCFFTLAGAHLALYSWQAAAEDAGLPAAMEADGGPGRMLRFRGVSLAMNLDSPADVDAAVAEAEAAGATTLVPPHQTFWGGYGAHFADPDGHVWEVAHNPFWPIGEDGRPQIPPG